MTSRGFASALQLLSHFKQTPPRSPLSKVSIIDFVLTQGRGYRMSASTGLRNVRRNTTPLGLRWQTLTLPRVAAGRQPWAEDRSPVGAGDSPGCQHAITRRQL